MTGADQVNLQVPPGFVKVPGIDDPQRLMGQLREVVDVIGAGWPAAQREAMVALYQAGFGSLLNEGAIYVGFGYFRTDDGGVSTAALNVFVKDHPEPNPYLIVSQLLRSHAEGGPAHAPGVAATPLQLGCGPAALVLRMTLAPDDMPAAAPLAWQGQVVVPFPQGGKVVVIDLSTPCPAEAPYYAEILEGVAGTVAFSESAPAPDPTAAAVPPTVPAPARSRIADALG